MPNINTAYNWCVSTCNAPNVGYSQTYRNAQVHDGITYYDCSSFTWFALRYGGFDVIGAYNAKIGTYHGNAWVVHTMEWALPWLGFTRYNAKTQPWANGDIMSRSGHTEVVYDAQRKRTMGAHTNKRPLVDQVSISTYSSANSWTYGWHYKGGIVGDYQWYAKTTGVYENDSIEAYNNALMLYSILHDRGFTLESVCGILGNLCVESGLNPWYWEGDSPQEYGSTNGYGLFQYKPSTVYIGNEIAREITGYSPTWLNHTGTADDGTAQTYYFSELYGELNYYPTLLTPVTWAQYKHSEEAPNYLAIVFMRNYFRPETDDTLLLRQTNAMYWYNQLKNVIPPTPPPTKDIKHGMPLWFMTTRRPIIIR